MSFETHFGPTYSFAAVSSQPFVASPPSSHFTPPPSNTFSPSGIMFSSAVTGTWFSILGLLGLASVAVAAEKTEKCYSCSSANFETKWPRTTTDNKPLYLNKFPPYFNDSCLSMRGAIPIVPCINSVCVKLVIEEARSERAVCASETGPVIIRDCWSRIIGQENEEFSLKPINHKPVRLANPADISKSVGQILTCEGYLCNHSISTYFINKQLTIFSTAPSRSRQAAASKSESENSCENDGTISNDDDECDASKILKPFEIDPNLNLCESSKENRFLFSEATISNFDPGYDLKTRRGRRFRAIKPIGHGAFSLVWLAYDLEKKEFRVVKVFKYGEWLNRKETKILYKLRRHPHIIKLYEAFSCRDGLFGLVWLVYEPMGKNLEVLIHEAFENGEYFSMDVIKKVAKHILSALKSLHEFEIDGKKMIHSDVKPLNIVVCTSQRSIHDQLKNIVNSRESLIPFRMVNRRDCRFDEEKIRARLKRCVKNVPEEETFNGLAFKLFGFGNVMEEGKHEFALVELLTCQRFIPSKKGIFCWNRSEMKEMSKMFGKLPRELYTNANFPWGYKKKFTAEGLNHDDVKMRFRNALQETIQSYPMYDEMSDDDRQELFDFLSNMLDFNPKRKTAEELLTFSWLDDVI